MFRRKQTLKDNWKSKITERWCIVVVL